MTVEDAESLLRWKNLRFVRWAQAGGRADLTGANLVGAKLTGANLSGANLSGANLGRVDLRGSNLRGANLSGANLRGADIGGPMPWAHGRSPSAGSWRSPPGSSGMPGSG